MKQFITFMVLMLLGIAAAGTSAQALISLGVGTAPVLSPVAGVTDVAWNLNPANAGQVQSADLTFTDDLVADSFVCLHVRNTASTIQGNGCSTVPSGGLTSANPITVPFDSSPNPMPSAAAITQVDVTVIQPVATAPGVTVTGWTLDDDDIRLVKSTTLEFDDDVAGGSWVCAQVRDSGNAVLDYGCTFFGFGGLTTGSPAIVDFDSNPINPGAQLIVRIDVTVSQSVE